MTSAAPCRSALPRPSAPLQWDRVKQPRTFFRLKAAFTEAAAAWRATLLTADDAALSTVGWSAYPNGSDPEDVFIDTVWWVNQEVLHHGAEIALLRDLYRAK